MTIDLKRLQEQRAALAKQMHDLLETAEKRRTRLHR